MISEFDKYIYSLMLEAIPPKPNEEEEDAPSPEAGQMPDPSGNAPDEAGGMGDDLSGDIPEEMGEPDKPTFPEELELAKLAVRALYFNKDSKDVHNLVMHISGHDIPFEKVSDYFEKTKKIVPILSFVEWVMDRYEGLSSKWTEQPSIRGKMIKDKLKYFMSLPEEERLDNGKRVYWTRIILNCLLQGTSNININIADVNEKNITEVFRLLKQHFGHDTRGLFSPKLDNIEGTGVF